jgi:hypothetical protein
LVKICGNAAQWQNTSFSSETVRPLTYQPAISPAMTNDPQVSAFLDDYIGLYARDTLALWRQLFLPGATATSANADGSVTTWSRDAFFERQRASFATGKPIRETLENTHSARTGPLVSVRSDFLWTDGEITRRGRLMLLLVVERGALLIQAVTFDYDR